MIQQINKLIEINLSLLYVSAEGILHLNDFKDLQHNKLYDARNLAEIMQQKELIQPHHEKEKSYELTDFGNHVSENGGWLMHLEKFKADKLENKIEETTQSNVHLKPAFWKRLFIIFKYSNRKSHKPS